MELAFQSMDEDPVLAILLGWRDVASLHELKMEIIQNTVKRGEVIVVDNETELRNVGYKTMRDFSWGKTKHTSASHDQISSVISSKRLAAQIVS